MILINISDIAIITGDNKYKTKRDYLLDFWKKNNATDYKQYVQIIKSITPDKVIKETDEEIVKAMTNTIAKETNIKLDEELKKCSTLATTTDLNITKKNIIKEINKIDSIDKEQKAKINKSLTSIINKNFGIKNEDSIIKLYQDIKQCIVTVDCPYHKTKILTINNKKIYIGGKIDGLDLKNNCVIEIKNRINKLFYTIPEYEKIQIMCYLVLFKSKIGHLVEAHKMENDIEINIVEFQYDKEFAKIIFEKIKKFIIYYDGFLSNHELKINILNNIEDVNF
jgi:hypothetical protein